MLWPWFLVVVTADFSCTEHEVELWDDVRLQMDKMLPRYAGRLSFVHLSEDLPAVQAIHSSIIGKLAIPADLLQAQVPLPWREENPWSFCLSGLLSSKLVFVMLGLSGKSQHAGHLGAALATSVMPAPWLEILQSGWPVFRLLSILSRWASPYMDFTGANFSGPQGRAAARSAFSIESACDQAEFGAMQRARELLGVHYRNLDPTVQSDLDQVEDSLAELRGSSRKEERSRGRGTYQCYWTHHPNRTLGGHIDIEDTGNALDACAAVETCVGILQSSQHSLRIGEPFLQKSLGEVSQVRWCTPQISPADGKDSTLLCPFARAVGLLASVARWLSNSSTLQSFSPELVKQANLEVAAFCSVFSGHGDAHRPGREAWATQWPLWQVLGRIQQRMDLLQDPVSGSPGTTVLPSLQHAMGFDDEAWRLVLRELDTVSAQVKAPAALRERVRCISGTSCAAEFFARLHTMLFSSERLPLRDQIFMYNEDSILPEYMVRSKRMNWNDVKEIEYDWKEMVEAVKARIAEGRELTREEQMQSLQPKEHILQVDRMQLAHFILEVKDEILREGPLSRCLEWDQPILLVGAFAEFCRHIDLYSYSEPHPSEPRLGLPGRKEYKSGTIHYWGDMERPENFSVDPGSMDLILCPFIFEHVAKPWMAIRTLADTLRPGGFVVWAAPMFQRYHGSPHDYYRYTPNGVKALAEEAGLEVARIYAPGDLSLVNGVLMGMLLPYWSEDQILRESELVERDTAPRYPLNVFALLRKPGERPDPW